MKYSEKRNKGFTSIILVALVLVVLAGVFVYYSQQQRNLSQNTSNNPPLSAASIVPSQPEENSALQTYSNETYSFSFKHPKDWSIRVPSLEGKHESNKTLLQVNVANTLDSKNKILLENSKDILSMVIVVWDKEGMTFNESLINWDAFKQNPQPILSTNKQINAINWIVREISNDSKVPVLQYVTEKDDVLYFVTVSPRDSNLISTADEILSSFEFTK